MKHIRHIPATMATQHPDNACAPYWERDGDGYISSREEVEECFSSFSDLGCQEFMWDWEGKYVDEAIADRLFHTYHDYFKQHQLGKDIFLTFRIPNIWNEPGYHVSRALMGILTAAQYAQSFGLHTPPLFEVILPMTTSAGQMIHIQNTFARMAAFQKKLFDVKPTFDYLRVLPLIESVDELINCHSLLTQYVQLHEQTFKRKPDYVRVHIARSDPALNAGFVPAVLAAKVAIAESHRFGSETSIPIFPAIGVGGLPFRGGLMPNRVSWFMQEYPGVRTVYIQSAFRYDVPRTVAQRAIETLNVSLPDISPLQFSQSDILTIKKLCDLFSKPYRKTVEQLAPFISELACHVPRRRERKLHVGLFGYSRSIGSKQLPRAIPFTAILYSLGIPPEYIGTGRGLYEAQKRGIDIQPFIPTLRDQLQRIGRFVNKENIEFLAKDHHLVWKQISEDITLVEQLLQISCEPKSHTDYIYRNMSSTMYHRWKAHKPITQEIIELGKLRKSLG